MSNGEAPAPAAECGGGMQREKSMMSSKSSISTGKFARGDISRGLRMAMHQEADSSHYTDVRLRSGRFDASADRWGSFFVVRKKSILRRLWTVLVTILLLYIATIFVYRIAFVTFRIDLSNASVPGDRTQNDGWTSFDDFVNLVFWVDLFVNFFFSYQDEDDREIVSLRWVAMHYLTTYFFVNLLSCIPEEVLAGLVETASRGRAPPSINALARTLRLRRAMRLTKFFRMSKVAEIVASGPGWLRYMVEGRGFHLAHLLVGLLWTVHMLACGWYIVAALHENPEDTWVARRMVSSTSSLIDSSPVDQWVHAMYFVLTVFTTVGFGDMYATTIGEIVYVCFVMAIGAVVHSIIVGEVIKTVTSNDNSQREVESKLDLVNAFAEYAELDARSKVGMQHWVRSSAKLWASRRFSREDMAEMLTSRSMPRSLMADLPAALFDGKLLQNDFLRVQKGAVRSVPPRLPFAIALASRKAAYQPDSVVYWTQDYASSIFFVLHGVFAYVASPSLRGGLPILEPKPATTRRPIRTPPKLQGGLTRLLGDLHEDEWQPSPYQTFSHGSYFGDIEVFGRCRRKTTARCETGGQVLILQHDDLAQLQKDFPHFFSKWVAAAVRRERQRARKQLGLKDVQSYEDAARSTIAECVRRFLAKRHSVEQKEGWSWLSMNMVSQAAAAVEKENQKAGEDGMTANAADTADMSASSPGPSSWRSADLAGRLSSVEGRLSSVERGMAAVHGKLDIILSAVSADAKQPAALMANL